MKNVIYLITVCSFLVICSCSKDTNQNAEKSSDKKVEEPIDNIAEAVTSGTDTIENSTTEEPIASVEETVTAESVKTETNSEETESSPTPVETPKSTPTKSNTPTKAPTTKPVKESTPIKIETTQPVTPVKTETKPPKPTPQPSPTPKAEPKPQPVPPSTKPAPQDAKPDAKPEISHSAWNNLLQKNVSSSGVVDYAAFKQQKASLEIYLAHLEEFPPQNDWSSNKKLAYWFNLYNAWTVKTIIDHYPVNSITDIDGGKTWNVKRVKSGNNTYSLDEIENKIIRPRFNDGRIHFAVNCAAKSCPPLLNRAWTQSNTASYLEKMTKQFINNSQYNEISANKVRISKIFEWYAADFGDIITYLNKYSNTKINTDAQVEYIEYDWALNGK